MRGCVSEKELEQLTGWKKQRLREKKKRKTREDEVYKRIAEVIRLEEITTFAKYQPRRAHPDVKAVQPKHGTSIFLTKGNNP